MSEETAKHQKWATRIAEWMTALPPDSAIGWTSVDVTAEEPSASGWVDVEVPEILDLLQVGWVWTVIAPAERDASLEDPLTLVVPPDTDDGWTPDSISRALKEWARAQTGRDDLRFEWDPTIDSMMRSWIEYSNERAANQERFQVAENVFVSEDAFDSLLKLPFETAGEITRQMQEVAEWHVKHDEPNNSDPR